MADQEFERVVQEGMAALKKSRERLKTDRDKPKDWEEITPEPLKPAVKHIAREFKSAAWQLAQQIECGAYISLHVELATLPRYKGGENLIRSDLRETWHLQFEGMNEAERFADWVKQYSDSLEHKIVAPFHALMKIGLANQVSLELPAVEWARTITRGLLYSLKWTVPHLIKRMCDEQEQKLEINTANLDAHCAWSYWRVPNFVIMQPSGNAPYNAVAAWGRLEDAEITETILRGLTGKMVEPAWFKLDRLAGEAYVTQASVATVDLAEILNEDATPPQQQSVVHDHIETPVSMEEAGKAYPVRAAATPHGPQNSPPPTLLLIATQREVEQARDQCVPAIAYASYCPWNFHLAAC
jgi:hypothetical protein